MFRKIVSNLSFSPALVGQLSFYYHRLRKEEATRRLGVFFVILALVVQGLVVFSPPQSANAASDNDFVPGGLGLGSNLSLNNFLAPYDANVGNLKDIVTSMGITREEIVNTTFGTYWTPGKISWGRQSRAHMAGSVTVYNSEWQQVGTVYGAWQERYTGNDYIYGYIGHSAKVGWFAIMQACGNIITDIVPPSPTPPQPEPTPQEPAKLEFSKTATNTSQGDIDATKKVAKASDRIIYTITAENSGGEDGTVVFEDQLADVLEYATLIDTGGGTFDQKTKILTWPQITLKAGEKQSRTYSVSILATIPPAPQGISNPASYDCKIENVFGNGTVVPVECAAPKVIENVVAELPKTGPAENMIFAGVVLAVVTYFYLRSRQLGKEVRLIRRDLNTGAI